MIQLRFLKRKFFSLQDFLISKLLNYKSKYKKLKKYFYKNKYYTLFYEFQFISVGFT